MTFLTIAVPTFNRADDLALLLESFKSELTVAPDCEIEILVVSNASTDSTDALVASYASSIPGLRYIKNDSNIGMQGNFIKCLKESAGRYSWLIGDDEFLEPGAIAKVVHVLKTYAGNALFIFNYSSEPHPPGQRFLTQVNNQNLVSCQQKVIDFVNEKGWLWALGNMGMVIVETAKLLPVDPAPHMKSPFVQAGWYLEALHNESLVFIDEVIFRTRIKSQTVNKDRWATDGTMAGFYYISDSLDRFVELNITPREVPVMFLNACSSNILPIWNFFLKPVIQRLQAGNFNVDNREWEIMLSLIARVADPVLRDAMAGYLNLLRRSVTATFANYENSLFIINRFQGHLFYSMV